MIPSTKQEAALTLLRQAGFPAAAYGDEKIALRDNARARITVIPASCADLFVRTRARADSHRVPV